MALILPKYLVNGYSKYMVPTCPLELDRSHPLVRGLLFYIMPGLSSVDLAGNLQTGLYEGNVGLGVSPGGPSCNFGGSAGSVVFADSGVGSQFTASYTLVWRGVVSNLAQYNNFISKSSSYYPAPFDWYSLANTGNVYFSVSTAGSVAVTNVLTAGKLTTLVVVVPIVAGVTNPSLYRNGVFMGSCSLAAVAANNATKPFTIGSDDTGITQMNGYADLVAGFNWAFSANEVAQISAEPFALLRPVKSKLWFFPSITTSGALSGMLSGQDTTRAALSGKGSLTGSLLGADSTTAALKGFSNSTGSAAGTDSTVGTLSSLNRVSGNLSGANTSSGTLSGKGSLSGTITGTDSTAGTVAGTVLVSGTLSGSDSSSGTLSGKITEYITGSVSGFDNTVSTLSGMGNLAGDISGISNLYIKASGFGHQLTTTGAG